MGLTLLIVRAGARDSLGWWDDEALTAAGAFALRRIFPREPKRAATRLAFRAAKERHAGKLESAGVGPSVTLFDLTEGLVEAHTALPADLDDPIASSDELGRRMREVEPRVSTLHLPEPDAFGLLDLTAFVDHSTFSLGERATILAAGYLTAQVGKPVYPYLRRPGGGAR